LDNDWVNSCEGLIWLKEIDIEDDHIVLDLETDKVEKAKFWAFKEVMITAPLGINGNLVPRSASSTRDNEKLAIDLKAFVRMAMPTEKETALPMLKKRIGKKCLDLLVWMNNPAVGKRRFMAADNNVLNFFIPVKFFKFP
jgi:hypothetical protein